MSTRPKKRLTLRHNFLWILAGSMVKNGAKWAMFIALTKTMTAEVVGSFALALAITTPISILAQMQLRVALITDAGDEHRFGAYYALRLITMAVSVIIMAAVAAGLYGATTMAALIVIVGLAQTAQSLRDIWIGLAQKHERMDVTARGNMLDGVLSLLLFVVGLLLSKNILIAATGMMCASFLTWLIYDRPHVRQVVGDEVATVPEWHPRAMVKLFWVALPLGLTTALVSLNSNIPRYLIEYFLDKKHVGYYASIAYFVLVTRLVIGSLGRAASPRLAILFRKSRRRYLVLVLKLVVIALALGAVNVSLALAIGEPFLRIVYNEEYARYSHILVILLGASGIGYVNSFLGTAISAARFFTIQPFISGTGVLTSLAAGLLLIPAYGLDGAAWAAVCTISLAVLINVCVVVYLYRHAPAPEPTP